MRNWVVRAHYASGDVVEEFETLADAQSGQERHRGKAQWISLAGPAPSGVTVPQRCSFCGKDRSRVGRLIAGPTDSGVAICDECVSLCNHIIGGSTPIGSPSGNR